MGEAAKWCRRAAEQGLPQSQYNLGVLYMNGQGVAKDEAQAFQWFKLATDQNFAVAQYYLGLLYMNGQGVKKSMDEAIKWFKRAAQNGNENAKDMLNKLQNK